MRHLDYLLQFTSDVRHLKEAENIPADAMSRTINAIFWDPCIDMTEFVKEQLKDQILQNLLRDNSISLKLTKIRVSNSNMCGLGWSRIFNSGQEPANSVKRKTQADTCWSFPFSTRTIRKRTHRHYWYFTSLWGVYIIVDMGQLFFLLVRVIVWVISPRFTLRN